MKPTIIDYVAPTCVAIVAKGYKNRGLVPIVAAYDVWYDVWLVNLQKPITPNGFKQHNHG